MLQSTQRLCSPWQRAVHSFLFHFLHTPSKPSSIKRFLWKCLSQSTPSWCSHPHSKSALTKHELHNKWLLNDWNRSGHSVICTSRYQLSVRLILLRISIYFQHSLFISHFSRFCAPVNTISRSFLLQNVFIQCWGQSRWLRIVYKDVLQWKGHTSIRPPSVMKRSLLYPKNQLSPDQYTVLPVLEKNTHYPVEFWRRCMTFEQTTFFDRLRRFGTSSVPVLWFTSS